MAIEPKLVRNSQEFREELTRHPNGWTGRRRYLVNTDIADKAMLSELLPKPGAAWSSEIPDLMATGHLEYERLGGKDTFGDGAGGWSKVTADFATPNLTPTAFVPADPLYVWTQVSVQIDRVNIKYPVARENAGEPFSPIANGDGVDIETGGLTVKVYRYYKKTDLIPFDLFISLVSPCRLNAGPIRLPRIEHTTQVWNVATGQALYLGPDQVSQVGDWIQVAHNLRVAPSFRFVWQLQNAKGEGIQSVEDTLYESGDFTGLWPGI